MRFLPLFKVAFWAASVIVLNACVSHKIDIKDPHYLDIRAIEHWQAKGKLSVRAQNQAKSANFEWKQNTPEFNIHIYGALGVGSARLEGNAESVKLFTNKGEMQSESAEGLMHTALGWSVPVSELRHWIKGVASPNSKIESHTLGINGQLQQLEQQGWKIQYTSYHQVGELFLPKKITAQRDEVKLTILIKSWQM